MQDQDMQDQDRQDQERQGDRDGDGTSGSRPEAKPLGQMLRESLKEVVEPFKGLVTAPRALWGVYIPYVLEGLVYFGVLTILGKYLSENVGLKDLHAGWVYSAATGGITLAMLFLGGVTDRIGIRLSLLVSLGILTLGRILLGASGSLFPHGQGAGSGMFFAVVLGLICVVLAYGLYQPAAYAGVKRFTNEKTATMAFAMLYGLMNLGAFFSGILSPAVRQSSGIVSVYWVYAALTGLAFLGTAVILTRLVVKRDTLTEIDKKKEDAGGPDAGADAGSEKPGVGRKEQRPLATPSFVAYAAGAALAFGALVYLGITAPVSAPEAALDELQQAYRAATKVLEGEAKDSRPEWYTEAGQALVAKGTKASDLAERIVPPDPGKMSSGATVDAPTIELLRVMEANFARLLCGVEDLGSGVEPGSASAVAIRNEARSLGIAHMAAAYSIASKVDAGVVDELQLRMKLADEERVPLPGGHAERIVRTADLKLSDRLTELAKDTRAAAVRLSRHGAKTLGTVVASEAEWLDAAAGRAVGAVAESFETLVQSRLLASSVLLIQTAAAPFVAEGDDARKVTGAMTLALVLASEDRFATEAQELAAGAIHLPRGERFVLWATRYGVLWLAAVVFLLLLGRDLLGKRPDHPFHDSRFVFFIFVLVPVQTLFAHNWLTLPYYINRAFGGTAVGNNFEFFSNINPILIFVLSPAVAALTARRKVYDMMVAGTAVMALPTFLLVLPPNPALLLVYILLMSVGEAMWQPRFLQWVAQIAPEGQTGAYMGIAQFPWFLTKVVTGLYSGYFLSRYCPMVGPQDTQTMWFIYALIAMASPAALVMARSWMQRGTGASRV